MKITYRKGAVRLAVVATACVLAAACGTSDPARSSGPSAAPPAGTAAPAAAGSADPAAGLPTSSGASCSLEGKKMIYVSVLRSNPVLQIMAQGAIDGAKQAGFADATWVASQQFDENQTVSLAQQAMAQGVDGVVVFATSPTFYPLIARAKALRIPVVEAHSAIEQGAAPGVVAQFYPDPKAYGTAAAESIGAELARLGKTGSIAITQTSFIPNENAAATAFRDTMTAKFPQQKVLDPVAEGGDATKAIAAETAIVNANPDLVAAFGTDGNGPVQWATTQKDTGRQLTVIAMDYAKANLDLVAGGQVFGVVAQPLYQEHYLASMALAKAVCNDPLAYDNPLPAPVVTKDAVQPYYQLLSRVNIR